MLLAVAITVALAPDVVELADGTRQVGVIETASDAATVRLSTPQGLLEIPASGIARIERNADLLRSFSGALEAARGKAHAFATLGQWCLERGLYSEAFDCADRLLALAPDEPAARELLDHLANDALLDSAAPAVAPDKVTRQRLLERIAGASASRSAVARELLLRLPQEELVATVIGDLGAVDPDVRAGAADLLGCVKNDTGLARVIRSSLIDPNPMVRRHAGTAAARSEHPQIVVPYLRALETDDARLRERAYPVLAQLRDPRAVPALIDLLKPRPAPPAGTASNALAHSNVFFGKQQAYVRDFDVQIAAGAVIAKPIIGVLTSGSVLDVAVAGVQTITYTERATVVDLLGRLTGQKKLGGDPVAWEAWWAKQDGQLPPLEATQNL